MAAHYAIVTGGNKGIGYAVCRKLLQQRRPVILAARDVTKGKDAAQQLSSFGDITFMQLDTSDKNSVSKFAEEVGHKHAGSIGVLVNNAGVALPNWSQEHWSGNVATNAAGPVLLTQALLPAMSDGGTVVMVSSEAGQVGTLSAHYQQVLEACGNIEDVLGIDFAPDSTMAGIMFPSYRMSKAMLNAATRFMAAKDATMMSKGIHMLTVCPGWCQTGIGGGAIAPRTAEQGADSVMWAVDNASAATHGLFYKDGQLLSW